MSNDLYFWALDYQLQLLELELNEELNNCTTETYYCCEESQNGAYEEFNSTDRYDQIKDDIIKLEIKKIKKI